MKLLRRLFHRHRPSVIGRLDGVNVDRCACGAVRVDYSTPGRMGGWMR